jgi:hypothetical protein
VILPLLTVGAPQQAAEALVAAANDAGGRDNVTAVVVDIVGDAWPADQTPTLIDQPAAWPGGRGGQPAGQAGPPEDVGLLGLGLIDPGPRGFGR